MLHLKTERYPAVSRGEATPEERAHMEQCISCKQVESVRSTTPSAEHEAEHAAIMSQLKGEPDDNVKAPGMPGLLDAVLSVRGDDPYPNVES